MSERLNGEDFGKMLARSEELKPEWMKLESLITGVQASYPEALGQRKPGNYQTIFYNSYRNDNPEKNYPDLINELEKYINDLPLRKNVKLLTDLLEQMKAMKIMLVVDTVKDDVSNLH